jgi:enterobacterial common antigen flippase
MHSFRTLAVDMAKYGLMGALSRCAGLLLLPFLTRLLNPQEYGVIEIVITLNALLAVISTLSLESAVARNWFECEQERTTKQLVTNILALVLGFGLLNVTVVWLFAPHIAEQLLGDASNGIFLSLGALAALFTALSSISGIVLRMERRIFKYNMLGLFHTMSYAGLTLFLIFSMKDQLLAVFLALTLAAGFSLVLGLLLISPFLSLRVSWLHLAPSLRYSLPLLPSVAIGWLNKQVDRFLLLTLLGLSAVGTFGAAARLASIISFLVMVFRQAWLPLSIESMGAEKGRSEFYRRALNYYSGFMLCCALPLIAYSKEILTVLVPAEYHPGYVAVPWLIGAFLLHGSANLTNIGMLLSKRTGGNSTAAAIGAISNIGLALLLIPRFGILGAGIGSFTAQLVFTALLWHRSTLVSDVRFDTQKLLAVLSIYVSMSILMICITESALLPLPSLFLRTVLLVVSLGTVLTLTIDESVYRSRYLLRVRS